MGLNLLLKRLESVRVEDWRSIESGRGRAEVRIAVKPRLVTIGELQLRISTAGCRKTRPR
jgi:hypothetical protein